MKKMILVLMWFLMLPVFAWANEYVLEKGKGVEVCEEYGKNLNSFKPAPYMRLERKLNPEFKDFSKPQWEKMYPEHKESEKLFPKINLFLWERDASPVYHDFVASGKNLRNSKKQRAEAWERYKARRQGLLAVGLPITNVDIDNDGKIENVILDSVNNEVLLILNNDKTDIDFKKTELLLQYPRLPADTDVSYTVFIYKQKAYFDFFHEVWEEKGHDSRWRRELLVFITENQKTEELCTYQFQFQ